jgi:predicted nucleotide-binding protein
MKRTKEYRGRRFQANAIIAAADEFRQLGETEGKMGLGPLSVDCPEEKWGFDSEQEFFTEYRRGLFDDAWYSIYGKSLEHGLQVWSSGTFTQVEITHPTRASIDQVFEVFERHLPMAETRVKRPTPVTVFIAHGHSLMWRDLKDHLHEQHGYAVEAYETGARAGHTVRDILADMLKASTFAVIVMSGEDETSDGGLRTRQNVVHEAGLFQGRLGFSRCIAVVEEGVEAFSNIDGVHQLRFPKGRIKETFGDILATLHREFPK